MLKTDNPCDIKPCLTNLPLSFHSCQKKEKKRNSLKRLNAILIDHIKRGTCWLRLSSHRVGLAVSVSASRAIGRGFAPPVGSWQKLSKNGKNCLPTWHTCVRIGLRQCRSSLHMGICTKA